MFKKKNSHQTLVFIGNSLHLHRFTNKKKQFCMKALYATYFFFFYYFYFSNKVKREFVCVR